MHNNNLANYWSVTSHKSIRFFNITPQIVLHFNFLKFFVLLNCLVIFLNSCMMFGWVHAVHPWSNYWRRHPITSGASPIEAVILIHLDLILNSLMRCILTLATNQVIFWDTISRLSSKTKEPLLFMRHRYSQYFTNAWFVIFLFSYILSLPNK